MEKLTREELLEKIKNNEVGSFSEHYFEHEWEATKPDFKVDNKIFRCEGSSDRWIIDGDDDNYYYDLKEQ